MLTLHELLYLKFIQASICAGTEVIISCVPTYHYFVMYLCIVVCFFFCLMELCDTFVELRATF